MPLLRAPGLGDESLTFILGQLRKAQQDLDSAIEQIKLLPDDAGRADRLKLYNRLQKRIDRTYSDLLTDARHWSFQEIPIVYRLGHLTASAQIGAGIDFTVVHREAVEHIAQDTYDDVATGLQQVPRSFRDYIDGLKSLEQLSHSKRDLIRVGARGAVAQQLLTGEKSPAAAARELRDQLLDQGVEIIDRSGRHWNPETYTRMLMRTKTAQAYNAGSLNKLREEGVGRVQVLDGTYDNECARANGQVWSVGYAYQHVIAHPNCTRAFAPMPGKGIAHRYSPQEIAKFAGGTLLREIIIEILSKEVRAWEIPESWELPEWARREIPQPVYEISLAQRIDEINDLRREFDQIIAPILAEQAEEAIRSGENVTVAAGRRLERNVRTALRGAALVGRVLLSADIPSESELSAFSRRIDRALREVAGGDPGARRAAEEMSHTLGTILSFHEAGTRVLTERGLGVVTDAQKQLQRYLAGPNPEDAENIASALERLIQFWFRSSSVTEYRQGLLATTASMQEAIDRIVTDTVFSVEGMDYGSTLQRLLEKLGGERYNPAVGGYNAMFGNVRDSWFLKRFGAVNDAAPDAIPGQSKWFHLFGKELGVDTDAAEFWFPFDGGPKNPDLSASAGIVASPFRKNWKTLQQDYGPYRALTRSQKRKQAAFHVLTQNNDDKLHNMMGIIDEDGVARVVPIDPELTFNAHLVDPDAPLFTGLSDQFVPWDEWEKIFRKEWRALLEGNFDALPRRDPKSPPILLNKDKTKAVQEAGFANDRSSLFDDVVHKIRVVGNEYDVAADELMIPWVSDTGDPNTFYLVPGRVGVFWQRKGSRLETKTVGTIYLDDEEESFVRRLLSGREDDRLVNSWVEAYNRLNPDQRRLYENYLRNRFGDRIAGENPIQEVAELNVIRLKEHVRRLLMTGTISLTSGVNDWVDFAGQRVVRLGQGVSLPLRDGNLARGRVVHLIEVPTPLGRQRFVMLVEGVDEIGVPLRVRLIEESEVRQRYFVGFRQAREVIRDFGRKVMAQLGSANMTMQPLYTPFGTIAGYETKAIEIVDDGAVEEMVKRGGLVRPLAEKVSERAVDEIMEVVNSVPEQLRPRRVILHNADPALHGWYIDDLADFGSETTRIVDGVEEVQVAGQWFRRGDLVVNPITISGLSPSIGYRVRIESGMTPAAAIDEVIGNLNFSGVRSTAQHELGHAVRDAQRRNAVSEIADRLLAKYEKLGTDAQAILDNDELFARFEQELTEQVQAWQDRWAKSVQNYFERILGIGAPHSSDLRQLRAVPPQFQYPAQVYLLPKGALGGAADDWAEEFAAELWRLIQTNGIPPSVPQELVDQLRSLDPPPPTGVSGLRRWIQRTSYVPTPFQFRFSRLRFSRDVLPEDLEYWATYTASDLRDDEAIRNLLDHRAHSRVQEGYSSIFDKQSETGWNGTFFNAKNEEVWYWLFDIVDEDTVKITIVPVEDVDIEDWSHAIQEFSDQVTAWATVAGFKRVDAAVDWYDGVTDSQGAAATRLLSNIGHLFDADKLRTSLLDGLARLDELSVRGMEVADDLLLDILRRTQPANKIQAATSAASSESTQPPYRTRVYSNRLGVVSKLRFSAYDWKYSDSHELMGMSAQVRVTHVKEVWPAIRGASGTSGFGELGPGVAEAKEWLYNLSLGYLPRSQFHIAPLRTRLEQIANTADDVGLAKAASELAEYIDLSYSFARRPGWTRGFAAEDFIRQDSRTAAQAIHQLAFLDLLDDSELTSWFVDFYFPGMVDFNDPQQVALLRDALKEVQDFIQIPPPGGYDSLEEVERRLADIWSSLLVKLPESARSPRVNDFVGSRKAWERIDEFYPKVTDRLNELLTESPGLVKVRRLDLDPGSDLESDVRRELRRRVLWSWLSHPINQALVPDYLSWGTNPDDLGGVVDGQVVRAWLTSTAQRYWDSPQPLTRRLLQAIEENLNPDASNLVAFKVLLEERPATNWLQLHTQPGVPLLTTRHLTLSRRTRVAAILPHEIQETGDPGLDLLQTLFPSRFILPSYENGLDRPVIVAVGDHRNDLISTKTLKSDSAVPQPHKSSIGSYVGSGYQRINRAARNIDGATSISSSTRDDLWRIDEALEMPTQADVWSAGKVQRALQQPMMRSIGLEVPYSWWEAHVGDDVFDVGVGSWTYSPVMWQEWRPVKLLGDFSDLPEVGRVMTTTREAEIFVPRGTIFRVMGVHDMWIVKASSAELQEFDSGIFPASVMRHIEAGGYGEHVWHHKVVVLKAIDVVSSEEMSALGFLPRGGRSVTVAADEVVQPRDVVRVLSHVEGRYQVLAEGTVVDVNPDLYVRLLQPDGVQRNYFFSDYPGHVRIEILERGTGARPAPPPAPTPPHRPTGPASIAGVVGEPVPAGGAAAKAVPTKGADFVSVVQEIIDDLNATPYAQVPGIKTDSKYDDLWLVFNPHPIGGTAPASQVFLPNLLDAVSDTLPSWVAGKKTGHWGFIQMQQILLHPNKFTKEQVRIAVLKNWGVVQAKGLGLLDEIDEAAAKGLFKLGQPTVIAKIEDVMRPASIWTNEPFSIKDLAYSPVDEFAGAIPVRLSYVIGNQEETLIGWVSATGKSAPPLLNTNVIVNPDFDAPAGFVKGGFGPEHFGDISNSSWIMFEHNKYGPMLWLDELWSSEGVPAVTLEYLHKTYSNIDPTVNLLDVEIPSYLKTMHVLLEKKGHNFGNKSVNDVAGILNDAGDQALSEALIHSLDFFGVNGNEVTVLQLLDYWDTYIKESGDWESVLPAVPIQNIPFADIFSLAEYQAGHEGNYFIKSALGDWDIWVTISFGSDQEGWDLVHTVASITYVSNKDGGITKALMIPGGDILVPHGQASLVNAGPDNNIIGATIVDWYLGARPKAGSTVTIKYELPNVGLQQLTGTVKKWDVTGSIELETDVGGTDFIPVNYVRGYRIYPNTVNVELDKLSFYDSAATFIANAKPNTYAQINVIIDGAHETFSGIVTYVDELAGTVTLDHTFTITSSFDHGASVQFVAKVINTPVSKAVTHVSSVTIEPNDVIEAIGHPFIKLVDKFVDDGLSAEFALDLVDDFVRSFETHATAVGSNLITTGVDHVPTTWFSTFVSDFLVDEWESGSGLSTLQLAKFRDAVVSAAGDAATQLDDDLLLNEFIDLLKLHLGIPGAVTEVVSHAIETPTQAVVYPLSELMSQWAPIFTESTYGVAKAFGTWVKELKYWTSTKETQAGLDLIGATGGRISDDIIDFLAEGMYRYEEIEPTLYWGKVLDGPTGSVIGNALGFSLGELNDHFVGALQKILESLKLIKTEDFTLDEFYDEVIDKVNAFLPGGLP